MPTSKKKKLVLVPDAEAREWIHLKSQMLKIQNRLDDLKKTIEPYLLAQKDKEAYFHGFLFTLSEVTRENFSLKKAIEKLDPKLLKPFITKNTFTQIRTIWRGGISEKEAA